MSLKFLSSHAYGEPLLMLSKLSSSCQCIKWKDSACVHSKTNALGYDSTSNSDIKRNDLRRNRKKEARILFTRWSVIFIPFTSFFFHQNSSTRPVEHFTFIVPKISFKIISLSLLFKCVFQRSKCDIQSNVIYSAHIDVRRETR